MNLFINIINLVLLVSIVSAKTTPYLSVEQPFVESTVCQTKQCLAKGQSLNANLNRSVDPCHDFYSFACGGWEEQHTLKNNVVDMFTVAGNEIYSSLMDSLKRNRSSNDPESVQFASDLFKSCIDLGKLQF